MGKSRRLTYNTRSKASCAAEGAERVLGGSRRQVGRPHLPAGQVLPAAVPGASPVTRTTAVVLCADED